MSKIIVRIVLCIFTHCSLFSQVTESVPVIDFDESVMLISNVNYNFVLNGIDEELNYIVTGKGFSINKDVNGYGIWVKMDSIHYLDISKIENNDTSLVKRKYFDVIAQGDPEVIWGGSSEEADTVNITRDQITGLKEIKSRSKWTDSKSKSWPIHTVFMQLNQKNYRSNDGQLNNEMIDALLSINSPTKINFIILYNGPDQIRRSFEFERTLILIE